MQLVYQSVLLLIFLLFKSVNSRRYDNQQNQDSCYNPNPPPCFCDMKRTIAALNEMVGPVKF